MEDPLQGNTSVKQADLWFDQIEPIARDLTSSYGMQPTTIGASFMEHLYIWSLVARSSTTKTATMEKYKQHLEELEK